MTAADIAAEARETLRACGIGQQMEAEATRAALNLAGANDEPEDPADSEHWLPGIDDVADHVREGDR